MTATAASLLACGHKTEETTIPGFRLTDTMSARIELDTARMEKVRSELKFSGSVTPQDNKMTTVYPVVAGYVTNINVTLGDYVSKGQVLATIRSTDIADFEKQRRDAENDLSVANRNLRSAQELYDSKLSTERDVAGAQKEVENAKAELSRVNEVFTIYHIRKGSNYNIVAPISGFVIEKKINADMQLPSGYSESIFTIAQIDEVYVTANVYETDIAKLKPGMPAEVELVSYPGKRLTGKIDRILHVLDPETKTLKIRIRLPNPGYELKPDMAATVFVFREEEQQLPAVPSAAIVFDKSRNYVLVYHAKDSIETRLVETSRATGQITYITSGIEPGEKVIVKNSLLVYDAIND